MAAKKLPGFILGVSNTEEEIYFHGGGSRIVNDDASGQVNPDSVFWVCSETKLVTYVRIPAILYPHGLVLMTLD